MKPSTASVRQPHAADVPLLSLLPELLRTCASGPFLTSTAALARGYRSFVIRFQNSVLWARVETFLLLASSVPSSDGMSRLLEG